jgi:anthranilate phosphoribosyltransferase
VAEVRDGVRSYEITPQEFGLSTAPLSSLAGGDATENARIVREILGGEKSPRRDVVLMNAAAALVVAGKAEHLKDAVPIAAESIDSGRATQKLDALVKFTTQLNH